MTEVFQNAGILFIGFFALVMLLLGVVLISLGLFTLQRHKAAAGWPQVPGVIEVSEITAKPHFKNNLMYQPVIRYRYGAPGGPYTGEKIANTGKLYTKEKDARKIAARYSVGGTVMVRYNPVDPSEAVLERGASGAIWLVCFGLLCWILPAGAGIAAKFPWQIMTAVFAGLVFLLTVLMLKSGSSLARARSRGLLPPRGSCSDADVIALMARGEKRIAFRLYRELHGCDLKEAREAAERLGHDARPHTPAT
ncbi:MAG: DUF3592 domain-containing protein [Desulfobacteraceae bacterium]|nr:MAG: DUF3592 domain-containing protein [Desulfobacteraceae bacterium]